MDVLDKKIKSALSKEIEEPYTYERAIKRALYKKNKKNIKYYLKRAIIIIISILSTLIGSFGVYAATGGKIDGIPALDWLGNKFSEKYAEYKQPVENQVVAFGETSVELTSTMCNEGITILEFDVKLSKEDYNNLKLGETAYTEEFYNKIQEYKEYTKQKMIKRIQADKYEGHFSNESDDEIDTILSKIEVTEEEIKNSQYYQEYLQMTKLYEKQLEERKNTGFKIGLALNTKQKGGIYNYDKFNPNTEWYASIYIDNEPYYVKNWQQVQKINDYEYKLYTMYALTDSELKGKESFKITLKNNKLVNMVAWKSLGDNWSNDCQWFAEDRDNQNNMCLPEKYIKDLNLDFEVNVSKDAVLKDSKVIDNPQIESKFRNITQTVEKVVISPMQTIVRINHSASNQSSNAFENRYDNPNIEHLPITREYKVYDANGKELSCFSTSNKNTLIYSDGSREDYDYHDIPNKKYSNAIWENIQYLLIEKTDSEYIKIVPVETIQNPVDGTENMRREINYEMEPLIINLK